MKCQTLIQWTLRTKLYEEQKKTYLYLFCMVHALECEVVEKRESFSFNSIDKKVYSLHINESRIENQSQFFCSARRSPNSSAVPKTCHTFDWAWICLVGIISLLLLLLIGNIWMELNAFKMRLSSARLCCGFLVVLIVCCELEAASFHHRRTNGGDRKCGYEVSFTWFIDKSLLLNLNGRKPEYYIKRLIIYRFELANHKYSKRRNWNIDLDSSRLRYFWIFIFATKMDESFILLWGKWQLKSIKK